MGVYLVGSYDEDGGLKPIGQFFELDVALAAAIPGYPGVESAGG
jgi:hypothetical protein